jgi:3-oxoacyl-[acyl-carrier-protein] synthase II
MGAVTPLGVGVGRLWEGVSAGECGVRRITKFDTSKSKVKLAAEVTDFDPGDLIDRKERKRMDRFTQFAVVASLEALADAGISSEAGQVDPKRMGVAIGSGVGGMETIEEQYRRFLERGPEWVSPFFIPMMITNMAAGNVAIILNAKGPSSSVVTACASASHTIGDAFRTIQDGRADVMVTGGTEAAITAFSVAGFASMQALSTQEDPNDAPRPFDRRRDGFVMGEGAGMLVLESREHAEARGARIYAEMAGIGTSTDAYHITSPSPGGEGAARAMEEALRDAGAAPDEVGYVNAHGTGTPLNDKLETEAIKQTFGSHASKLAVSSTKSMVGHLLGAAGAVEAIVTILALDRGFIPPTIHYGEPDPECDLDYVPNTGRPASLEWAISNSLGFGGHNATLVFKKYGGN